MKQKVILFFLIISILFNFSIPSLADETTLRIETTGKYSSMSASYANGYIPTVGGGQAHVVLPLIDPGTDDIFENIITVTPILPLDGPFRHVNYEFEVTRDVNGVYLIDRSYPLNPKRVNGTYEITFLVQYKDDLGEPFTQSFTVYVTIVDGIDPDYEEPEPTPEPTPPVAGELRIDSNTLYPGMEKSYAQGYVPTVVNGTATIILPLIGLAYYGEVTLTADLGELEDNPFVVGNYSQTVYGRGQYVFQLDIPLRNDRYNGSYPVTLYADYLDLDGMMTQQSFTVTVTISDGQEPPDPYADPEPEPVDKPELFISNCVIAPESVSGDEQFTVEVTIDNIGSLRARNAKLTYGSDEEGILPAETAGAILLGTIDNGKSTTASFILKTTHDVLAGNRSFYVALDYIDLYGGEYSSTRQFLISVYQPVDITYDLVVLPKEVEAGETITIPSNVFNIGKSYLRNVTITLTGAGLYPKSSVFLGDIPPGEPGIGEMEVLVEIPAATEEFDASSGILSGNYVIRYQDDTGEMYSVDMEVETKITNLEPEIEESYEDVYMEGYAADAADDDAGEENGDPPIQWWVIAIIGLAVVLIILAIIVLYMFARKTRHGR